MCSLTFIWDIHSEYRELVHVLVLQPDTEIEWNEIIRYVMNLHKMDLNIVKWGNKINIVLKKCI